MSVREHLKKAFLLKKGINYKDCTPRQKDILDKEKPELWDLYTWDLK